MFKKKYIDTHFSQSIFLVVISTKEKKSVLLMRKTILKPTKEPLFSWEIAGEYNMKLKVSHLDCGPCTRLSNVQTEVQTKVWRRLCSKVPIQNYQSCDPYSSAACQTSGDGPHDVWVVFLDVWSGGQCLLSSRLVWSPAAELPVMMRAAAGPHSQYGPVKVA